ncbi:MAG: ATP-binding protein [Streptosporangiaceae bacterium]
MTGHRHTYRQSGRVRPHMSSNAAMGRAMIVRRFWLAPQGADHAGAAVTSENDHFGDLLRLYRVAARMTQEELAEKSGLSVRAISDLERGRRRKPYRRSVLLLADALQLAEMSRAGFVLAARPPPAGAGDPAVDHGHQVWRQADGPVPPEGVPARASSPDLPAGLRLPLKLVPRQVPGTVDYFVSRWEPQRLLYGLLNQVGRTSCTVVISGTAGVGKTALAVHWAHQIAEKFPDGQLYVNLRGFDPSGEPVPSELAIRGFLDALQVPPGQVPVDAAAQAALYRSIMADRTMLVILDNARDADQVRPLLPGAAGCLTVITSRSNLLGLVAGEGAHPLPLDVLTRAEAAELLSARLGTGRVVNEPEAVADLSDLCARLPLALNVAAARGLAHPRLPLAELAAELRDAAQPLGALDTGDTATSPRSVFSWSYQSLRPSAARLFELLGMHLGPHFSASAAASLAGIPVVDARASLDELARASLINISAGRRFAFHDLLRAFAVEQAEAHLSATQRRVAMRRLLDHYLHTACAADWLLNPAREPITVAIPAADVIVAPPADPAQSLAWFESEHRGLVAAISYAVQAELDVHAWQLAWSLVTFYDRHGFWHDWVATQDLAIRASRRLGDRVAEGLAHRNAGRAHLQLGSYAAADQHLRRSLEISRRLGDRIGQARIHNDIGRALSARKLYREALEHEREALDFFRAEDHTGGQAGALNAIGCDLARLGDYAEALGYCEQALDLCRATGMRHGEAATLDSLAFAHQQLGHLPQAMAHYQQALALNREIGNSWGEAVVLDHLGDLHHVQADEGSACEAWRRAAAILDELQHPDVEQIREKVLVSQRDAVLQPQRHS